MYITTCFKRYYYNNKQIHKRYILRSTEHLDWDLTQNIHDNDDAHHINISNGALKGLKLKIKTMNIHYFNIDSIST